MSFAHICNKRYEFPKRVSRGWRPGHSTKRVHNWRALFMAGGNEMLAVEAARREPAAVMNNDGL